MAKKKRNMKLSKREENMFPFLVLSLEERLRLSGAVNLNNDYSFKKDGHYDIIQPSNKKDEKSRDNSREV
ncbi:hypothetical protein GA0116948_103390 [Chitinophaga costaii]|uniref:Uncharacterized protein n=1 Tax=Chitinophaga costaii TaxID=1335309 RepID=A0A1C4C3R9_9BACT|nr:hypothetical protein DCM91_03715 [Chitinophaga costaii]SCC13702.1 hypothetical protein GA0116948_103390 [Chitinophaga costaii]